MLPSNPHVRKAESRERRGIFTAIHDVKAWGDCESHSGPGSTRERAASFLLCRDALVHLSDVAIIGALRNLAATGAEYLLATTFVGERPNPNIANGEWRPLNMQRPPFSFPTPLELVDERCHHTGGIYGDKRLALWRFNDLARSIQA
jgi:hypothetical protein